MARPAAPGPPGLGPQASHRDSAATQARRTRHPVRSGPTWQLAFDWDNTVTGCLRYLARSSSLCMSQLWCRVKLKLEFTKSPIRVQGQAKRTQLLPCQCSEASRLARAGGNDHHNFEMRYRWRRTSRPVQRNFSPQVAVGNLSVIIASNYIHITL